MSQDPKSSVNRRDLLAAAAAGAAATAGGAQAAETPPPPRASSYGQCPDDKALRTAWRQFCRRLEAMGDEVFKGYIPPTPGHRADGFRYMAQNLGQAFALGYETKDTQYPVIHAFCTPFIKLGGDNADCIYQQAWIDGRTVYKITGNRGTVKVLNITVQGPRPEKQPGTNWPSLHEPFGDVPEANIFGHQMKLNWDNSFELYVGGDRQGPNWLPTTAGSHKLFIRQLFDRFDEEPAQLRIERVGMTTPRPAPTPRDMITAMDWMGGFMEGVMTDWPDGPYLYNPAHYDRYRNRFPPDLGSDPSQDRKRGRAIHNMAWEIQPDEALVLEFNDHKGLWMFTNMGEFFNSLDYLYRPVSYTPSRTKVDKDGKVRLVLCSGDPGYHNWVDNQGLVRGNITYRHFLSDELAVMETKLVKRDQLPSVLPPDTAKVTPEQRAQQLHERFDGIRRRFAI
jgi:hypothetical protein